MAETRDNSGTLNKNKDKSAPDANPKWADYKGKCVIGGQEFWISAWVKEYQGEKFMSLAFKPKDAAPAGNYPRTQQDIRNQPKAPSPFGDEKQFEDDQIPF